MSGREESDVDSSTVGSATAVPATIQRQSQLAFLTDDIGHDDDGVHVAKVRRAAVLRGIDADFLLELAEPFSIYNEAPADATAIEGDPNPMASPSSFAGGPLSSPQPSATNFSLANDSAASLSLTGVTPPSGRTLPPRHFYGRVPIIGPSGSGKSTFKHCVNTKFHFNLPDVPSTMFNGSNRFNFSVSATANRAAERLHVELVDMASAHQRSVLVQHLAPADLIVLTWSLATVKQTRKRQGVFSGYVDTAVFHERDVTAIAAIVRDLSIVAPGTPLVVVGTHKDVLSEQNIPSVEKVVQTLERHVTEAIDAAARGETLVCTSTTTSKSTTPALTPQLSPERGRPSGGVASTARSVFAPPVLLGTYAVSCVNGKCVGSSGGIQVTINEMWRTACESILKGARTQISLRNVDVKSLRFFDSCTEFLELVDRVSRYFTCLRSEHGIVLLGVHQLAQAFFAFGAPSRKTVDAVLSVLQHRGELVVLERTREYQQQALLLPHVPSRIIASVQALSEALKATKEERGQKFKLVSLEDCLAADGARELARGVLKRPVIRQLAAAVPSSVAQDRHVVFVRVARQIGFAFRLNESAPNKPCMSKSLAGSTSADAQANKNASFFSHESGGTGTGERYIVPSLVNALIAPTTLGTLRREMESKRLHHCCRGVTVPVAPSGFYSILHCEVGRYMAQRTHITRTSIWLTHGSCRCFIVGDKEPNKLPEPVTLDLFFFGATGHHSLRDFALFVADVMQDVQQALRNAKVHDFASVHASTGLPRLLSPTSPIPGHHTTTIMSPSSSPNKAVSSPSSPLNESSISPALVSVSSAVKEDSVASLLRLDLCVAPLTPA
jgi:hypothetical protein